MVIDTSALLAILLDEPEHLAFLAAIDAHGTRLASAATILEASIVVMGKRGEAGVAELGALLKAIDIIATPFNSDQAEIAFQAFHRYGKGRHPAALNFGDCFSYALAKATDEMLLFKGQDFARTDVKRAPVDFAIR